MHIPDLPNTLITDEQLKAARISRPAFLERIQMHYCPILTKNSSCGRILNDTCAGCQKPLSGALQGILPRVRVPEAVVTWRLRGAAAMVGERQAIAIKKPQVHVDARGFKLPDNTAFDSLAKRLGV